MKTFEQQAANALRTLTVAISIVVVAVVGICGLATWGVLSSQSNAADLARQQAELKKAVQSPTHGKDIALWCNGINGIINYERQYTKGTLQQSESEAQTIEKAISNPNAHGLTTSQATFIRLYLDSVVALEREAPQTLSLHPFSLGDLNCTQIEATAVASSKIKH